jgi:hypothetical protein
MAEPPNESSTDPNGVDDRFRALLEGLRTTLPGVQVLFAFLLTLPLQGGFAEITRTERAAYFVALYTAAMSSIMLIAPSVHQRVRAPMTGVRRRDPSHLRFAAWVTIAGTVAFLVALGASIYLVSTIIFTPLWAGLATVGAVALAGWAWFYVPAVRWRDDG